MFSRRFQRVSESLSRRSEGIYTHFHALSVFRQSSLHLCAERLGHSTLHRHGGARKGCAQRLGAAERLRARAPQGVCADCPANLAIPSPITRLGTIIYNNFMCGPWPSTMRSVSVGVDAALRVVSVSWFMFLDVGAWECRRPCFPVSTP